MNENIAQEILDELFSSLEALEAQSTAILQFLKAKGIANDEELAPHFEQAGNASGVRWRAARVRIDYLLSSAIKLAEQDDKKDRQEPPPNTATEASRGREAGKDAEGMQRVPAGGEPEAKDVDANADKSRKQQGEENNGTSKNGEEKVA
jgi:hypothetical protein